MRRIRVNVLIAFALLLSSSTLTSATASGDDSFRVTDVSNQFEAVDVGDKGESLGDQIVVSDDVYKGEDLVGSLDGFCTTTRIEAAAFHQECVVTLTLPRGQLTAQGVIRFDADFEDAFDIALTGGTGSYDDAAGEARVEFVSDTETTIEVDLEG